MNYKGILERRIVVAGIKDVAKRAGVGVGTVSRVLNGSGYVADETKEKIDDVIRRLELIKPQGDRTDMYNQE